MLSEMIDNNQHKNEGKKIQIAKMGQTKPRGGAYSEILDLPSHSGQQAIKGRDDGLLGQFKQGLGEQGGSLRL